MYPRDRTFSGAVRLRSWWLAAASSKVSTTVLPAAGCDGTPGVAGGAAPTGVRNPGSAESVNNTAASDMERAGIFFSCQVNFAGDTGFPESEDKLTFFDTFKFCRLCDTVYPCAGIIRTFKTRFTKLQPNDMNCRRYAGGLLLSGLFSAFFSGTPHAGADVSRQRASIHLRPPFLRPGDTVSVVTVSSNCRKKVDTSFIRTIASWGLTVKWANTFSAGTAVGLPEPTGSVPVICSGHSMILRPGGDFLQRGLRCDTHAGPSRPESAPETSKWLAGFSDVTVLHQALRKIGVESIHGTMPVLFRTDTLKTDTSALSLRDALFGEIGGYRTPPHAYNRPGRAEGRLVGGNLSLIYALNGTDLDNDMDESSVLFIEDVGENIYHIDRMMQNLKRSGKLARAKAVVVGYFNKMKFEKEWGADAEALINAYTASLGVPVIFGFPAGHASRNMSLYMGRRVSSSSRPGCGALEFPLTGMPLAV